MKTFKTVDAYIASYPKEVQVMMNRIRKTILKSAPMAEEGISYGMPVYKWNGVLTYFGGFKHHIGFFPGPGAIKKFAQYLSQYKLSKGTIQFQHDEPIPLEKIAKIVEYNVGQNMKK